MDSKKCSGWCTPLIIYIVFSVVGAAMMLYNIVRMPRNQPMCNVILSFAWTAFWGYVMYDVCMRCRTGWAWVILLLPFLLWFIMLMVVLVYAMRENGSCTVCNDTGDCVCMMTIDEKACNEKLGKFVHGSQC